MPQVKLNLNPEDVKRITSFIDAKVKYRVLKYEWKNNSVERYQSLQVNIYQHHQQTWLFVAIDKRVAFYSVLGNVLKCVPIVKY